MNITENNNNMDNCHFEIIRTLMCNYEDKDKLEAWIARQINKN